MRLSIDETHTDGAPAITPLAFGAGGPLIALVQERGTSPGRAVKRLVLAFDLIRTNWGRDVSFPIFVSSAVDFLTGRGEIESTDTLSAFWTDGAAAWDFQLFN